MMLLCWAGVGASMVHDDTDETDETEDTAAEVAALGGLLDHGAAAALEVRRITRMQRSWRVDTASLGAYDEILDEVEPGPGYLARKAGAPGWLTLGGEHRTRFEILDGQFRPGLAHQDRQLSHRTRLHLAVEDVLDPFRFVVVLQDSRTHFTPADGNVGSNHVDQNDVQQLHLDFVHDRFLGTSLPSELAFGRVNMDLGRGRWFAQNNFRNSTNAYDGAYWGLGERAGFHAQTFAVWPVDKAMRTLNPAFGGNRSFAWGSYVLLPPLVALPALRLELDYVQHRDDGPGRDFEMTGYRLFKPSGVRRVGFEIESQYQFGTLDGVRRFAHFHHGEIDYTFATRWNPEVQFKFDYATPGFDILYGRRSFELTPTGILGPFQRSNLLSGGWRVLLQPTPRFHAFFQHRLHWLADARAPWVGVGLVDASGAAGRFLGHTFELRARWRVLENVALQFGYTHFGHGGFLARAPGGTRDGASDYAHFATEITF